MHLPVSNAQLEKSLAAKNKELVKANEATTELRALCISIKRKLEEIGGSLDDGERATFDKCNGTLQQATHVGVSLMPPLLPLDPSATASAQPRFVLRMYGLPETSDITQPTRLQSPSNLPNPPFPQTMEWNTGMLEAHVSKNTGFHLRWRLVDLREPERAVNASELGPAQLRFALSLVFDENGTPVTGEDFDPYLGHLARPSGVLCDGAGRGRTAVAMDDGGRVHFHVTNLLALSSKVTKFSNPKFRFVVECVSTENELNSLKEPAVLRAESPAFYSHNKTKIPLE
jgi:hypothetical protein